MRSCPSETPDEASKASDLLCDDPAPSGDPGLSRLEVSCEAEPVYRLSPVETVLSGEVSTHEL